MPVYINNSKHPVALSLGNGLLVKFPVGFASVSDDDIAAIVSVYGENWGARCPEVSLSGRKAVPAPELEAEPPAVETAQQLVKRIGTIENLDEINQLFTAENSRENGQPRKSVLDALTKRFEELASGGDDQ